MMVVEAPVEEVMMMMMVVEPTMEEVVMVMVVIELRQLHLRLVVGAQGSIRSL